MLPLLTSTKLTRQPRNNNSNNNNNNNVDSNNNDNSVGNNNNGGEKTNCCRASTSRAQAEALQSLAPAPAAAGAPSLGARIGGKLSAVAGRLSNLLPSRTDSAGNARKSAPPLAEILYPDQCPEKASLLLVPTYIDEASSFLSAAAGPAAPEEERQCRICLLSSPADATPDRSQAAARQRRVVAPCRCAGTVQYVHIACLTHWIEVSSRKMQAVPRCELCGFRFRRKPFVDLRRLHFPYVDWCDRILNLLFLFLVTIMVLCGWVAIHYLCLSERRPLIRPSRNTNTKRFLTDNDVTVIIASILFFAAFFIALFTQYRAEVTVFRIMARLWATNRNWRIRDYDADLDDAPPAAEADVPTEPRKPAPTEQRGPDATGSDRPAVVEIVDEVTALGHGR